MMNGRTGSLFLVLLVAAAGCGAPEAEPDERLRSSVAAVDEALIRASTSGDDLRVSIPVERVGARTLAGRLTVRLVDASTTAPSIVRTRTLDISQSSRLATHTLVFPGAAPTTERAATVLQILDWRVAVDGPQLFGRRSLYAALGNLDVQLRGPTELATGATSPLRVIVRDPRTSRAIEGATVEAGLAVTDGEGVPVEHALFSGETDGHGEVLQAITLPTGVESGTIHVTVRHDDVEVWAEHGVRLRAEGQLYLCSDKTIYKPGQEVHLRLLAVDGPDRLPLAGVEALFEAKDGRGIKVYRRRVTTDAFGVAAVSVPVDTRVNEGTWKFSASIDGGRTELALPVEQYVLPKIRVNVATTHEYVIPGETLAGNLSAAYVFGEPVIDAAGTILAQTETGGSVGWWSGRTDAQGNVRFEMPVSTSLGVAGLEDQPQAIVLSADVVDSAGQAQQSVGARGSGCCPLRINSPASASLLRGEANRAYVLVTDAVGRPVRASVSIDGDASLTVDTDASASQS